MTVARVGRALPAAARVESHEVEARRTQVTRGEIRSAIARGLERVDGKPPSATLVDVLTAQASLETASGDRMYNYNFGGIKGHGPSGATARLRTKEVVDGREIEIKDGFRAYRSLDEGAIDYVKMMRGRFGAALEPAARGDVAGFAHALKKAGYYTAAESDYAKGLSTLLGAPVTGPSRSVHGISLPNVDLSLSQASGSPLSGADLSRVENTLDAGFWSSINGHSHHRASASSDDDDDS